MYLIVREEEFVDLNSVLSHSEDSHKEDIEEK